jgi:hypothetical protein
MRMGIILAILLERLPLNFAEPDVKHGCTALSKYHN